MDYDEEYVEVKHMSHIGNNRLFWPMRNDVTWYDYEAVVSLIPAIDNCLYDN